MAAMRIGHAANRNGSPSWRHKEFTDTFKLGTSVRASLTGIFWSA
jgi:hypothetical protein